MRDWQIAVIDSYGVTNLCEDDEDDEDEDEDEVDEFWRFWTSGDLQCELHVGINVSRARLCGCFVPRNDSKGCLCGCFAMWFATLRNDSIK